MPTNYGYNPSQTPTSYPSDFDEEYSSINRRREQLANALKSPIGGPESGWQGGVANFLQSYLFNKKIAEQDEREKEVARRRDEYGQIAIGEMPRDIPGMPATPAINTGEPPKELEQFGGGPPVGVPTGGMVPGGTGFDYVPGKEATPMIPATVQDWAKWSMKYAKQSPLMARVAEKGVDLAMAAPEKRALAEAAQKAKGEEAQRARDERAHQVELANIEKERQRENAEAERARQAEIARIDREAAREHEIRLAASLRPVKGEGGTAIKSKHEGYGSEGERVFVTPEGVSTTIAPKVDAKGRPVIGADGQPVMEHTVFTGEVTPKNVVEKNVEAATKLQSSLATAEKALAAVKANPDAFGFASLAAGTPGVGLAAKGLGLLKPEQIEAQAKVFRDQARVVKEIYGTAVTRGEDISKLQWAPQPGEDDRITAAKLSAALEYARTQLNAMPTAARALAKRRVGGGKPPLSEM